MLSITFAVISPMVLLRFSRLAALVAVATMSCKSGGRAGVDATTSWADGSSADRSDVFPADGSQPGSDVQPGEPVAPGAPFCSGGRGVEGVTAPAGLCLRHFASVKVARTLVVAPNGDVFVGAPATATAGGAAGGAGAIVLLADDDHDGIAETHTFATGVEDVHGIALGDGYLYFTTANTVWRTAYDSVRGQRLETGPREDLKLPVEFGRGGRWTHGLARSVGGQLLASRGEYNTCSQGPGGGEISSVGVANTTVIARGFRNPMYLRCHSRSEVCAATELGEDQMPGAREKLIMLRPDTEYGYPCCYTTDRAVATATQSLCTGVTREDAEFVLSETPFGLDWERELWPEPFRGALFVALHGSFYTSPPWAGARIVFARTDPASRAPIEPWRDFLGGFGPGGTMLERPSDVAFAPDGRLFFADDQGGNVYWIAPVGLTRQP